MNHIGHARVMMFDNNVINLSLLTIGDPNWVISRYMCLARPHSVDDLAFEYGGILREVKLN